MIKCFTLLLCLLFAAQIVWPQGVWTQKANLGNHGNQGTYGGSIGSKGYVLRGSIPDFFGRFQTNEMWEYDPSADSWTQKASTPAPVQNYGLALAVGNKGYFALTGGIWEYDPATDVWLRQLTLPAGIASFSTGFGIGGKAYFGWASGNQLWEFDPQTDTWVRKADFPGGTAGQCFSIGNRGYLVKAGQDTQNIYELWEYDPAADSWTQKTSFGGSKIGEPNNFSINDISSNGFEIAGRGYIATVSAINPYIFSGALWEYDPANDKWATINLAFNGRLNSVGFGIGSKGYLGFGFGTYRTGAPISRDLWEYSPATVVAPAPVIGTGTGLQAVYYNGIALTNTPLLARTDTSINFELTYSSIPQVLSPAPGVVQDDSYSVRWTGQVQPQYSETYTFYTVADDGIRLWVNGVKLVDNWANQDATTQSGSIALTAGERYDIKIEYYENKGNAVAKLLWSSANTPMAIVPRSQLYLPPAAGTGLLGQYFSGTNLSGTALLSRIDPTINFELTYSTQPQILSPAPGQVPEDGFSVRWTGKVQPKYTAYYTFYTQADDGVRLWVNGVQLVDNWTNQDATEKSGSLALVAGQQYDIVLEYYENTGNAVSKLLWSSAIEPKDIIPSAQLYPPGASGARAINASGLIAQVPATVFSSISPNPVKAGMQVRLGIQSEKNEEAVLRINAADGIVLRTQRLKLAQGNNTITVPAAALTRGWYIISIAVASKIHTYKLLVQ